MMGSCVNVASERLVKQLALSTTVHRTSYRLQWLSEKEELLMDKQTKVMLTIGGYGDRVVCDVVPMEALYLLLGRHWPFGKKVIHDGITNRFTFIHLGQRVMLKPLSPREVHEDKKIKLNKKESKSEVEKRIEKGKEKVGEKSKSVREKELHLSRKSKSKRKKKGILASMQNFLEEFQHVFLADIPHRVGATWPNRTTYRTNFEDVKEIQKQVGKLMEKGWVRETMSPCVIPIILVQKNMALGGYALIVDQ
ncbi:hypothetical protein CR513_42393, partial [Mucuna pruriens]